MNKKIINVEIKAEIDKITKTQYLNLEILIDVYNFLRDLRKSGKIVAMRNLVFKWLDDMK